MTAREVLEEVIKSITPIPDSDSCYIPKLVVMEVKSYLERTKTNNPSGYIRRRLEREKRDDGS